MFYMGIMKKVGYGVVGLIAIGVIGAAVQDEPVKPASTEVKKVEPKKEVSRVTEDNFNKIVQGDMFGEGGQTKEEVLALLGEPETTSTSNTTSMTIETASWNSKDYKVIIMIQFHNGKVSSKTITKI